MKDTSRMRMRHEAVNDVDDEVKDGTNEGARHDVMKQVQMPTKNGIGGYDMKRIRGSKWYDTRPRIIR